MAYKHPKNVPGLIRTKDGDFLAELASTVPDGQCIVEIGSFTGKSTCYLAKGSARSKDVMVFSVDPWDLLDHPISGSGLDICATRAEAEALFHENVGRCGFKKRVTAVKGFSADVAETWPSELRPPIGMLYIDGNHSLSGVTRDIEAWGHQVDTDGFMVFDDYQVAKSVTRAVDRLAAAGTWRKIDASNERFALLVRRAR